MQKSVLPILAFFMVVLAFRYSCKHPMHETATKISVSADSLTLIEDFVIYRNNDTIDSSAVHRFFDPARKQMNELTIIRKSHGKEVYRCETKYEITGEKTMITETFFLPGLADSSAAQGFFPNGKPHFFEIIKRTKDNNGYNFSCTFDSSGALSGEVYIGESDGKYYSRNYSAGEKISGQVYRLKNDSLTEFYQLQQEENGGFRLQYSKERFSQSQEYDSTGKLTRIFIDWFSNGTKYTRTYNYQYKTNGNPQSVRVFSSSQKGNEPMQAEEKTEFLKSFPDDTLMRQTQEIAMKMSFPLEKIRKKKH